MFFSTFDGHGGDATSRLLERTMHPTLALGLAGVQAGIVPGRKGWKAWADYLNTWMRGTAWTPENVVASIKDSSVPPAIAVRVLSQYATRFLQLNENICQTPIHLLPTLSKLSTEDSALDGAATYPTPNELFMMMAAPANSGACALSAVVDAANEDLYVAVTGDCRAVAGWQDEEGNWRCDVLTEDQMGENPREVERLRSEHPPSEKDTVIRRGRILSGLQTTRAFGDAAYKWTAQQTAAVVEAFAKEGSKAYSARQGSSTPPYVTARPEVTYRKLRARGGDQLRFIVMATDGLWDRITSEEATLLVASYLSHPKHEDIPKTSLPATYPLIPPIEPRPYPAEELPGSPDRADGAWVFEGDSNAATHLIRNSLAGADRQWRRELLSMRGKPTRQKRDDITVTVVFFDPETRMSR